MYQVMPAAISLPLFLAKKGSTFKQQIKNGENFFLELNQPNFFLYKVIQKKSWIARNFVHR